jgi:hypothetical protein
MLKFYKIDDISVAELTDESFLIKETQDALDLLGDVWFNHCNNIIISEKNLHPDFFRLHTKLAGDILQKFSTYSMRLAIVGDFTKYKSKSLQDFIRESNRGNRIFFTENIEEALKRLTGTVQEKPDIMQ